VTRVRNGKRDEAAVAFILLAFNVEEGILADKDVGEEFVAAWGKGGFFERRRERRAEQLLEEAVVTRDPGLSGVATTALTMLAMHGKNQLSAKDFLDRTLRG
jgi:hypothetical protein